MSNRVIEDDLYSRMANEADDYELSTIEAVAERAGIIWRCQARLDIGGYQRVCDAINREEDEACCECGTPRSYADGVLIGKTMAEPIRGIYQLPDGTIVLRSLE